MRKMSRFCCAVLILALSLAIGGFAAFASAPDPETPAAPAIPASDKTKTLWSFSGWTPEQDKIETEALENGFYRVTDTTTGAMAGGGQRIQIWTSSSVDVTRELNFYFALDQARTNDKLQLAIFLSETGAPEWVDAPLRFYFSLDGQEELASGGTGATMIFVGGESSVYFPCNPSAPAKVTVRIGAEKTQVLCNDTPVAELDVSLSTFEGKTVRAGFSVNHGADLTGGSADYTFRLNGEPSLKSAGTYYMNGSGDVKVLMDEDYSAFVEVYCDKEETATEPVAAENYTYANGVLTLKRDYLATLVSSGEGMIPFRLRYTSKDVPVQLAYSDEFVIDIPTEFTFDKSQGGYVMPVTSWNNATEVKLFAGETELTAAQAVIDTEGMEIRLADEYVRGLAIGEHLLTLRSEGFADREIAVTVKNSMQIAFASEAWTVSEEDLVVNVTLNYNQFLGLENVDAANYVFDEEAGTLALKASYLKTLENGKNRLVAKSDNGNVVFEILLNLTPMQFADGQSDSADFDVQSEENIVIRLNPGGREFVGVKDMTDKDYTWDEASGTLTLSADALREFLTGDYEIVISGEYNELTFGLRVYNSKSAAAKGETELTLTDATTELKFSVEANGGKFLYLRGANIPEAKYSYAEGVVMVDLAWFKSSASQTMSFAAVFDNGEVIFRVKDGRTAPTFGLSLDKTELSVEIGKEATILPSVTPEGAKILWTSSSENIVTVKDGVVTGVGYGTAVVSATVGDKTVTCTVTVTQAKKSGCGGGSDTALAVLSAILMLGTVKFLMK